MGALEPTKKSPEMTEYLEKGFGRTTAINSLSCVPKPFGCGRSIDPGEIECWDQLTIREYRISGLCKTCQDRVFGTDEED